MSYEIMLNSGEIAEILRNHFSQKGYTIKTNVFYVNIEGELCFVQMLAEDIIEKEEEEQ
ncbi:hypothetical protein [Bacillus sonorensis]|uniref:hypothetical protein n=1 Tax=Bacillus sonorensis TaxID=119858 RepID=UPI0028534CFA|nr:hypothetical protein [Bacillus sonorensis]MDR4959658.1 hypothetical protein [Bacillus sonorensis]